MSTLKHTPGPLEACSNLIRTRRTAEDGAGLLVAECPVNTGHATEDAARLVACWNACEGIPIGVLETQQSGGLPWRIFDQIDERITRAELIDALRPFANYACDAPCDCHNCRARALIAKATEASHG